MVSYGGPQLSSKTKSHGHMVPTHAFIKRNPCKNQTKIKFLWQGSKIQIVSSFAHEWTLVRQERLCIFFLKCVFFPRKTNFSLSPSRIDGSGHNRSKIEHFRSLRISKIFHQGKSNQRMLFYRLFVFCKR